MARPNYLPFGGLLMARLQSQLTDIRNIAKRGELDDVPIGDQALPAV